MGRPEGTGAENEATNSRAINDDTRATDDDQRGLAAQKHAAARRQQGFGVDREALRREAERAGQRLETVTLGLSAPTPKDNVQIRPALHSRGFGNLADNALPVGFATEERAYKFPAAEHFSPLLDFLNARGTAVSPRSKPAISTPATRLSKWWQEGFGSTPPKPDYFRKLSGITMKGNISLINAIGLLDHYTFRNILYEPDDRLKKSLAQNGVAWDVLANARLSDPRFTRNIIYIGPGIVVFFDTEGSILTEEVILKGKHRETRKLPISNPALVTKVWIPGRIGGARFLEGIYHSIRKDLTAAFAPGADPVLIAGKKIGPTFHKTFVESEKLHYSSWRGGDSLATVFVINNTFWSVESGADRVINYLPRVARTHLHMIRQGYLSKGLGKQIEALVKMSPEEFSSLVMQFAFDKINPFPSPEDIVWAMNVLIAWEMATLGRDNAEADMDVAARLLAHLYAGPLAMFLLSKAAKATSAVGKKPLSSRNQSSNSPSTSNRLHSDGGRFDPASRTPKGEIMDVVPESVDQGSPRRTEQTRSQSISQDATAGGAWVEQPPQRRLKKGGDKQDEVVSPTGERLDERPGNTEQAGQQSSSHVKETSPQEFRIGTRDKVGDRARSTSNTDAARHTTAEKNPHNQSSLPESERMRGNQGTTPVTGAPKSIGQLRQQLGKSRYEVLKRKAKSYLKRYHEATTTKDRKSVIDTVKGYVFESLIPKLGIHERMVRRSKDLAKKAGVDPESLKFTSDVRDRVGGSDLSRPTSKGELTDGIIYGTRKRKIKEGGKIKEVEEIVIFVVYESKSLRNFLRILKEKNDGGDFEPGQAERTRARLDSIESTGIFVDGKQYTSERVILPPDLGYRMPIIGVVPKDLSAKSRDNLETAMTKDGHEIVENQQRDFHVVESPLTNDDAFELAKEVLDELDAESD